MGLLYSGPGFMGMGMDVGVGTGVGVVWVWVWVWVWVCIIPVPRFKLLGPPPFSAMLTGGPPTPVTARSTAGGD